LQSLTNTHHVLVQSNHASWNDKRVLGNVPILDRACRSTIRSSDPVNVRCFCAIETKFVIKSCFAILVYIRADGR
jgi:hypothetical protein